MVCGQICMARVSIDIRDEKRSRWWFLCWCWTWCVVRVIVFWLPDMFGKPSKGKNLAFASSTNIISTHSDISFLMFFCMSYIRKHQKVTHRHLFAIQIRKFAVQALTFASFDWKELECSLRLSSLYFLSRKRCQSRMFSDWSISAWQKRLLTAYGEDFYFFLFVIDAEPTEAGAQVLRILCLNVRGCLARQKTETDLKWQKWRKT